MIRHPWDTTVTRHRDGLAAIGRAVQRPSIWEPGLAPVPRDTECVRCFRQLEEDRSAICTACATTCPDCDGSGFIPVGRAAVQAACAYCDGTGKVPA